MTATFFYVRALPSRFRAHGLIRHVSLCFCYKWAIAYHVVRCVTKRHLNLPKTLPAGLQPEANLGGRGSIHATSSYFPPVSP